MTVSIVIPTWQRHKLLEETIMHIQEQTYKDIEIIVVCDGVDKNIMQYVPLYFDPKKPRTRVVELGFNTSSMLHNSFGIAPLLVGYLMAQGKYIMPWCDDERALTPDHIKKLVNLIETPIQDDIYPNFVYPKVKIWRNGNPDGQETTVIGTDPPKYTQITHYLFRQSNLWEHGLPDFGTHPVDWSLIHKWLNSGVYWAMLDECTFEHRLDN